MRQLSLNNAAEESCIIEFHDRGVSLGVAVLADMLPMWLKLSSDVSVECQNDAIPVLLRDVCYTSCIEILLLRSVHVRPSFR